MNHSTLMATQPKVTIILLNYNSIELLKKYVPYLLDLEYSNYELVVVDNDSDDGSVQYILDEYPSINVIENEENYGFSRGNNIGARAATDSDYIWFLNTDVKVEGTTLCRLVRRMEENEDLGVVGPTLKRMVSPHDTQSAGYKFDKFGYTEPITKEINVPYEVAYVSGAALLIDQTTWADIGGFDSNHFIYGDDDYICLLAWIHGYTVECVPSSVVYHEVGGTRKKTIKAKKAYYWAKNRTRTYLKLLDSSTLIQGFIGYIVIYFILQIIKDMFVRQSPKLCIYRAIGYIAALSDPYGIIHDRRRIQNNRVRRDSDFISPGSLLLSNIKSNVKDRFLGRN